MTIVILDTGGLRKDWVFRQTNARKLLDHSALATFSLEIPEPAYREIEKKVRADAAIATQKIENGVQRLGELGLGLDPATLLGAGDAAADQIWSQVEERLKQVNARVLPLTDISHDDLMKRSIPELKPWAPSNKGYHDALIWDIVKARLTETNEDFVLVTVNTNDFSYGGDDKYPTLHEELVEDLSNAGIDPKRLKLTYGIEPLLELVVPEIQEVAQQLTHELRSRGAVWDEVSNKVIELVSEEPFERTDEVMVANAFLDNPDPVITTFYLGQVAVSKALDEGGGDSVTIVFVAEFEVEFELAINDFEIYTLRDTDPSIDCELIGETHGIATTPMLDGSATIYATYDRTTGDFSNWERADVRIDPYDDEPEVRRILGHAQR